MAKSSFFSGSIPNDDISSAKAYAEAAAASAALAANASFDHLITSFGGVAGLQFNDRTTGSDNAFQWFANDAVARLFSLGSLSAVMSVTEAGDVQAPSLRLSPVSGVRAVNITQALPSTLGALAGAVIGNVLSTSIDTEVQASIDPRTGLPGEAGTPYAANWVGFQFSGSVGPNYDATGMVGNVGQAFTLSAGLVTSGANATDSDLSCGSLGFSNNYAFPNSRGYGLTLSSTVGLAGTQKELIGLEAAVSIFNPTAGAVQRRRALNLLSYGDHKASVLDAAIFVQQGNPGGEFQNVIALAGANALSTTGSIITAEVAQTIDSVINLPLLDITGYIVNTKHGKWTGAGVGTFGSATSTGGLVLAGAAGANLPLLFSHGGATTYQVGAVAANLYITATGFGTPALTVNAANQVSLNGYVVTTSGAPTLDDWFNQSVKTTASPQFAGINVGHVSDTTITRASPGVIAVENVNVLLDGGALGTPASGTLTHCSGLPQTGVNNLGLVLISTQVASSSASIDFTGLDDTYDDYELVISSIRPATDATELMLRVGTGGTPTYQTTGYRWSGFTIVNGGSAAGGGSDTKISLTCGGTAGNDVGENTSSIVRFSNPEASLFMEAAFETRYTRSDGFSVMAIGAGAYATSGAVTALRVAFASGNIASGRISLYGRRKS